MRIYSYVLMLHVCMYMNICILGWSFIALQVNLAMLGVIDS